MVNKLDKLELFWVMSDALTSSNAVERDQALLVLHALFSDLNRNGREKLLKPSKREHRRLLLAVWGQLHAAGLLRPRRYAYAVYVAAIVDHIAWVLEGKDLDEARSIFRHLSYRVRPKWYTEDCFKLTRDVNLGSRTTMFFLDGLHTREVLSPDGV